MSALSLSGSILSWTFSDPTITSVRVYKGASTILTVSGLYADVSGYLTTSGTTLYVVSLSPDTSTEIADSSSNTVTYIPVPPVVTLSGTILSWTRPESWVYYTVYAGTAGLVRVSRYINLPNSTSYVDVSFQMTSTQRFSIKTIRPGQLSSSTSFIASSNTYLYTPSIPVVSLCGSILSWTNADAFATYKVYYNSSTLVGTTSAYSMDIVNSLVVGTNTFTVKSYNGAQLIASSPSISYTPSTPVASLSDSILSWTNQDTHVIYNVYVGNQYGAYAYNGANQLFAGISGMYVDISNVIGKILPNWNSDVGAMIYFTVVSVFSLQQPTELTTSNLVTYIPSTPSNLSLSGSILSWTNADTFVMYTIYNNSTFVGSTSGYYFHITIQSGTNSFTVRSYIETYVYNPEYETFDILTNSLATSSPITYTSSIPVLSLSGTILSWTNTDTNVLYNIYAGNQYGNSYGGGAIQILSGISGMSVDISNVIGQVLPNANTIVGPMFFFTVVSTGYSGIERSISNMVSYPHLYIPFLSLSGTILSWVDTDTNVVFNVYAGNIFDEGSKTRGAIQILSGISDMYTDISNVVGQVLPNANNYVAAIKYFTIEAVESSGSRSIWSNTVMYTLPSSTNPVLSISGTILSWTNTVSNAVYNVFGGGIFGSQYFNGAVTILADFFGLSFDISGFIGKRTIILGDVYWASPMIRFSVAALEGLLPGEQLSSNVIEYTLSSPVVSLSGTILSWTNADTFITRFNVYGLSIYGVSYSIGNYNGAGFTTCNVKLLSDYSGTYVDISNVVGTPLTNPNGNVEPMIYFAVIALSNDISSEQIALTTSNIVMYTAPSPPSVVPCFLGSAPVRTPTGYTKISKLVAGDKVLTADDRTVAIKKVSHTRVEASPSVNPYVIPKGLYGATKRFLLSPDHRVQTDAGLIEAKHLGLQQESMAGSFDYYNLELPDWKHDNMVVAGVVVESLAPVRRMTMTNAQFKAQLIAKYGTITPEVLNMVERSCRDLGNGYVDCPVLPK